MPTVSLVACGAPLASRLDDVAKALDVAGWSVSVMATESAAQWLGERGQGLGARRPDALAVCPLTFNTANKWLLGLADTRPMSLLCEALGAGIPMVAVPFLNDSLWAHPAVATTLDGLVRAGVRLLDPATGKLGPQPVQSGTGDDVAARFDPAWLVDALPELR